jgi:hypothetical protein
VCDMPLLRPCFVCSMITCSTLFKPKLPARLSSVLHSEMELERTCEWRPIALVTTVISMLGREQWLLDYL